MKKIPAAALLLVMLGTGSVSALSLTTYPGAVSQGNLLFNAGVGWGKPRNGSLNLPPLQFSLDMPIPLGNLPFTLGGFFELYQAREAALKANYLGLAFGGRINYHINLNVSPLDLYLGAALGWEFGFWSPSIPGTPDFSQFYSGFYLGSRYFFNDTLGLFAEVGLGLSIGKIGFSCKF